MTNFLENFKNPSREYSLAPFWFLNDDMEPEHLRWQLREMCDKHVYECILHARKGLTVPYLSETWFERIGIILDEAKELGMRVYIYDEDNWPSGYAGGRVVEANPEFAAKCLGFEKIIPVLGKPITIREIPDRPVVRVIAAHRNEEFFDITGQEWASSELQYEVFVFRSEVCGHKPAYSDTPYVDLLNAETTKEFIRVTHAEYKRRFPQHWGSTIKGFFTDEPGFYQNYIYQAANLNTIPWTEDFPVYFKQKKGYDIMPYLGSVWDEMGELSSRTRRDYFEVLVEKYNDCFFQPIQDFLAEDGLVSIGHLHMEEHLDNIVPMEGDFFAAMKHLDYAGIDRINREHDSVTEKLGSSAMNLQGKKFCFSETYGCYGWHLTLEEMKREADFQYVQGINKMVPHAFYSSTEGFRVTECPPSEFYQNTFWEQFSGYADYVTRLSYALSEGNFASNVLVYYPIKSAHEIFRPLETYELKKLDEAFIDLSGYLLKHQIDFNYVDDSSMQAAELSNGRCNINHTGYKVIILPQLTMIPEKTMEVLLRFAEAGGIILDLSRSEILSDKIRDAQRIVLKKEEIPAFLAEQRMLEFALHVPDEKIKYQHRRIGGNDLYFITNESLEGKNPVVTLSARGNAKILNPLDGSIRELPIIEKDGAITSILPLDGYGSLLLYFEADSISEVVLRDWEILYPDGATKKDELKLWTEYGFTDYSGSMMYQTTFELEDVKSVVLDLGDVRETAAIVVNGQKAADLIWRPYRVDISEFVQKGQNTLCITVSNTPSNELTEYQLDSGLLGPVKLSIF